MQYSNILDNDLDDIIRHIKIDHPNDGEVLIGGIRVQHLYTV